MRICSSEHRRIIRCFIAIVRGGREGRDVKMKRAMILALVLFAALAPLASIAHADLRSDETVVQAP